MTNFFDLILKESENYLSLESIEKALESSSNLEQFPVQPLYLAFNQLTLEQQSALVPRLGQKQRQLFMDIDLWRKDQLDIGQFERWITIYSQVEEKLQYEFTKSEEFALFLKARFNMWTFDVEDPLYPDHDYYFLTDDQMFLIEYDPDCEYATELKTLIKNLYTHEGVENAYTYLFKIVTDQMGLMQEEEYRFKKGRLEDLGMMDYYDSLEHTHSFHQEGQIKAFLSKATPSTGSIDDESKNQTLNYQLVSSFKNLDQELENELSKVDDTFRQDFLRFNFIKLINANIELSGGLQKGTIELHSQIKKSKTEIELGLHYAQYFWAQFNKDGNILDALTLTDLYRIGHSLLEINRRKLSKKFSELNLDETFDHFAAVILSD